MHFEKVLLQPDHSEERKNAQSNNNFTFSRPLWLLSGPFNDILPVVNSKIVDNYNNLLIETLSFVIRNWNTHAMSKPI